MPRKPKEKYKTRSNGTKETTRSYVDFGLQHFTGKKHFYGKTDAIIDKKIAEFEASLNTPPKGKLLTYVIDEWWTAKEPKLSPNSVQGYLTKKNEIDAEFGDIPVNELTAMQVIVWLNKIADRGYSQRSVSDRKSVIKNIMDYALSHGYITVNPCISLPIVKGVPKKKRKPASDSDVDKIEAHKTDSMIARLYYFLEYTGCRIGEAIVLQEKDIDREHHKAAIYKDLAYDGNNPLVKENPKTEAGIREIDLYDNVLEILPHHEDKDTYTFFPDGLPRRSRLQRMQKKFQKEIGITSTPHQLRHTYAGIMHSAEIDVKDTQARLGHANISITQDIYTEIEKAYNEKTRNKANDYIMRERLGREQKKCPQCGSTYLRFDDGHICSFCPDCGQKIGSGQE